MYIIIHKYQRWPVNVERPQSKYLKISLKTNKSNIKMMVCQKVIRWISSERKKPYVHFMLRERGRFLVFRHLHYVNIRKSLYMVT